MSIQHIEEARSIARTIIQRIVHEREFTEQLRNDPHATLLGAGFPDWAVDDFIANDLGLESDVQGYSLDRCAVTSLLWLDDDGVLSQ